MKHHKILLIYSGGTIGMVRDYQTKALIPFDFQNLLQQIPELNHLECAITPITLGQPIDSSNMTPKYWQELGQIIADHYEHFDGFVILHGSDTMSYTASALSFMLQGLDKPVILTGSQLPIGDLRTDAKENLITAVQIASLKENGRALIQEVGLYFEYKLYRGNRSTKISAAHFNAFSSPNYPHLLESGFELVINSNYLFRKVPTKQFSFQPKMVADLALIKLFPGITAQFLSSIILMPNLKVVVLETFGAGNAPEEKWFFELIKEATLKGVIFINVTQCVTGSVMMGAYATSSQLKSLGVLNGKDMTTEAALTKTMFLLGQNIVGSDFKKDFEKSLCGECS